MAWYGTNGAVRRLQLHLNWFDAEYHGILGGPLKVTGQLSPDFKAKLKRAERYLGFPDAKIAWATLPFSVQRLIDCLHHPSEVGNPIWRLRGVRRRRAYAAQHAATHISAAGVRFIAGFEGFSPTWYDDGTGTMTIGYGHTDESNVRAPITRTQGLALLERDLVIYENQVKARVRTHLTTGQFDALVSFVFNLGGGALDSGIAAKVNRRDFRGATAQMLLYDHAGGQRLPGLTRRRQAEVAMFLGR